METYLPIIKTTLSAWLQLTLSNPLYAAALAIAVYLLTAIIYSIKVASLKKKTIVSENARIEMQNSLSAAQQQMQKIQEELTANSEQMQKDRQLAQNEAERASGLEELLSQRNKQIAHIIQSLATSFDLGERPLTITEDIKAEGLWQQHDRVITLLTTRLLIEQQAKTQLQQSYQSETVKRAETEALLETLRTTLAAQTSQVSKLEQELEEQKSILQQQQDKAELILSKTLENHQSELARLPELEQQALELANTRQQLTQLEEKLNAKDALITQLEKDKPVNQAITQPQAALIKQEEKETVIDLKKSDEEATPVPSYVDEQSVSPINEQTGGVAGKIQNLFKSKPQTEDTHQEKKSQPASLEADQPPSIAVKEQVDGITEKLKNLLGKAGQKPITDKPIVAEEKLDKAETQPVPSELNQLQAITTKSQFGKLKNLFGSKQQSEDTHPKEETHPASSEVEQLQVSTAKSQFGKLKNLLGSKQQTEDSNKDISEIQTAPLEAELPPVSPAKGRFGKIKYYFGDINQQPEDTKQDEEESQPAPIVVAEQPPVSTAKGQLGKLKNLFGKTK